MAEPRITLLTLKVLTAMVNDSTSKHYGYDLMQAAGISSGTLYPLLARLEKCNWITASWEDADPAQLGRGRRKYYELTERGRWVALEEAGKIQVTGRPAIRIGGLANV